MNTTIADRQPPDRNPPTTTGFVDDTPDFSNSFPVYVDKVLLNPVVSLSLVSITVGQATLGGAVKIVVDWNKTNFPKVVNTIKHEFTKAGFDTTYRLNLNLDIKEPKFTFFLKLNSKIADNPQNLYDRATDFVLRRTDQFSQELQQSQASTIDFRIHKFVEDSATLLESTFGFKKAPKEYVAKLYELAAMAAYPSSIQPSIKPDTSLTQEEVEEEGITLNTSFDSKTDDQTDSSNSQPNEELDEDQD